MGRLKGFYQKLVDEVYGLVMHKLEQCLEENRKLAERVGKLEENIRKNNDRLNGLERATDETRLKKLEENIRKNNDRLNGLERATDETRLKKLEENIRKNNDRLNGLERATDETRVKKLEDNIRKNNDRLNGLERATDETRLKKLEENIRKNNDRLNGLERATDETRLKKLEENIRKNNDRLNALERATDEVRLAKLEDNIRKNNQRLNELEKADSTLEMNLIKVKSQIGSAGNVGAGKDSGNIAAAAVTETAGRESSAPKGNEYSKIDYFDFENHFRGPCQNVKERQKMYIPYFQQCHSVLDIGCGRGEFLELLKESNISAKGVDLYPEYAEYCRMKGLDVECGDGIQHLMKCGKLDGIMASQLVEHLDTDEIVTLCEAAYEKLNENGVLVMETPNPKALSIYVNEFYMDPSHIKPVHPETLKYLVRKAGFREAEILFTEISRVPKAIPKLDLEVQGNLQEFNAGMEEVSELLYGSRDYAIIARK